MGRGRRLHHHGAVAIHFFGLFFKSVSPLHFPIFAPSLNYWEAPAGIRRQGDSSMKRKEERRIIGPAAKRSAFSTITTNGWVTIERLCWHFFPCVRCVDTTMNTVVSGCVCFLNQKEPSLTIWTGQIVRQPFQNKWWILWKRKMLLSCHSVSKHAWPREREIVKRKSVFFPSLTHTQHTHSLYLSHRHTGAQKQSNSRVKSGLT